MPCSLERLRKEPELLQADQDQLKRQAQVRNDADSCQAYHPGYQALKQGWLRSASLAWAVSTADWHGSRSH